MLGVVSVVGQGGGLDAGELAHERLHLAGKVREGHGVAVEERLGGDGARATVLRVHVVRVQTHAGRQDQGRGQECKSRRLL